MGMSRGDQEELPLRKINAFTIHEMFENPFFAKHEFIEIVSMNNRIIPVSLMEFDIRKNIEYRSERSVVRESSDGHQITLYASRQKTPIIVINQPRYTSKCWINSPVV